jgi:primosomal protein N'
VFGRSPKQRQLYETLEQLGGQAPVAHLRDQLTISDSVVKGLVGRGLARIE